MLFWSLYFVTNYINTDREYKKLDGNIDNSIKLKPIFSIFYPLYFLEVMLVFVVFFKRINIFRLVVTMLVINILIHNMIFLLYPVAIERPNIPDDGFLNKLTLFYYKVDKPYNAFPSMHISLITISFLFLYFYWSKKYSIMVLPLYILTALSTLFIKQHYLLDVISGLLIGLALFLISKIKLKNKSSFS